MIYPITGGEVQIDADDLELVSQFRWHKNDRGYAVWRGMRYGKKQTLRMHRLIMSTPPDMVTDHINHDTLDNRKQNLRNVTQHENMQNLKNHGKGYWYQKQNNNWVVEVLGKHRGTFDTEWEAAEFVQLIREGKADMKPKPPERTHCKRGHLMENPIILRNSKVCRTCSYQRSSEYFKRTYVPKPRKIKEVNS